MTRSGDCSVKCVLLAAALVVSCRSVVSRAPDRLPARASEVPAARIEAARVLERLALDPIRRVGDPIVPKLVALRALGVIEMRDCHTHRPIVTLGERAACVDVAWERTSVRVRVNDDSLNRTTIAVETSAARTVVLLWNQSVTERRALLLDDRGVVREHIALPAVFTGLLVRSRVLLDGTGWLSSAMGESFDLGLFGPSQNSWIARRRELLDRACVALDQGTLCERNSADRDDPFRYDPLGSDGESVSPRVAASIAADALRTPVRVLMRLRETEDGADLLVGLPFANGERGAALIAHFEHRTKVLAIEREIDFHSVPPERRRFCGSHAETQVQRHDRQSIAIACGDQALVSVTLRAPEAPQVTLLLAEPLSKAEFRVLPPVGGTPNGVLYAH